MIRLDGRRIIVTGATGFIGRNLVRKLAAAGADLSLLVRPGSDLTPVAGCVPAGACLAHDGTIDGMCRIFEKVRPELVIHLASLFIADHRPDQIDGLIDSNLKFATQLLEAMTQTGCGRLLNTGTSWQNYGDAPYRPVNLYAATKQAFEDILAYYGDARGIVHLTLRLFDTYGPDDPRQKLVTLLCRIAASGERLEMSPGEQLVDLVHIDDVCDAYLVATERLFTGGEQRTPEVYGVSSGTALPLREVVARFEAANGVKLSIVWGGRPYREREVMVPWQASPPVPGWQPRIPLEVGLQLLR